jgi:hypothetical protein
LEARLSNPLHPDDLSCRDHLALSSAHKRSGKVEMPLRDEF